MVIMTCFVSFSPDWSPGSQCQTPLSCWHTAGTDICCRQSWIVNSIEMCCNRWLSTGMSTVGYHRWHGYLHLSILDSMQPLTSNAVIDERPKSPIEKRKRNLIFFSPISRRERETWNSFPQFREGKEKFEKGFSTFEKWKRKGFSFLKFREEKEIFFKKSPISRREREIWNSFLQFREKKEKPEIPFSSFERKKRNL